RGLPAPRTAARPAPPPLLGFIVLLNLDLLLARHHLTAAAAGEYAVGAIVAKGPFWLPEGVGVALPRRRRARAAALAVAPAGGGMPAGATAALGPAALPLIGGAAYGDALGGAT